MIYEGKFTNVVDFPLNIIWNRLLGKIYYCWHIAFDVPTCHLAFCYVAVLRVNKVNCYFMPDLNFILLFNHYKFLFIVIHFSNNSKKLVFFSYNVLTIYILLRFSNHTKIGFPSTFNVNHNYHRWLKWWNEFKEMNGCNNTATFTLFPFVIHTIRVMWRNSMFN